MGQPINQGSQGATEVWAYESGNGRVTTNATYNRFGASAVSVGRFYHINIVMSNGRVLAVNNTGPTGGGLTAGEQCAYAVENCTQPRQREHVFYLEDKGRSVLLMASGEAPVKAGLFVMVKPLIAAEKVFEHAECFYQASVALRNQLPVRLRPDHSENIHAAITLTEPLIVLDALTSELFLKCLICIETGDTPRGHNLERLFNQLSKATRTRIQSYWDSEISTRRREKWDNFERVGLKVSRDLPTALANGNNAFERYRYSYEGNTQDLHYYLEDLPPLLERLILEMKPEFEAFRRGPLPSQQMLHQ